MIDPRHLFDLLNQEKVNAVLVGGVAMIAQGVTHYTNDIDLCYRRDHDNMEALARALIPLHPRLRVEGLTDEQSRNLPFQLDINFLRNTESLTLTTDLGDIDLLGRISGIGGYDDLLPYIVELNMRGTPVPVLNLEGLIVNKRAAARNKDLSALPHIEATLRLREVAAERAERGVDNTIAPTKEEDRGYTDGGR